WVRSPSDTMWYVPTICLKLVGSPLPNFKVGEEIRLINHDKLYASGIGMMFHKRGRLKSFENNMWAVTLYGNGTVHVSENCIEIVSSDKWIAGEKAVLCNPDELENLGLTRKREGRVVLLEKRYHGFISPERRNLESWQVYDATSAITWN